MLRRVVPARPPALHTCYVLSRIDPRTAGPATRVTGRAMRALDRTTRRPHIARVRDTTPGNVRIRDAVPGSIRLAHDVRIVVAQRL